jgi:hypothetical protein
MQNAKCKSQNGGEQFPVSQFAFCILHFDFAFPPAGAFSSQAKDGKPQRLPGSGLTRP